MRGSAAVAVTGACAGACAGAGVAAAGGDCIASAPEAAAKATAMTAATAAMRAITVERVVAGRIEGSECIGCIVSTQFPEAGWLHFDHDSRRSTQATRPRSDP